MAVTVHAKAAKLPQVIIAAVCLSLAAVMLGGCAEQICPADHPPDQIQLSPSGRAVAYVDHQIFNNILGWLEGEDSEVDTSFDCLIDVFTARFANDVDMILIVLNVSREELFQRIDHQTISNFTATQRVFESGIGTVRLPLPTPVGPPSMRSYSFLGIREGLLAGPSLHELAHSWCAYLNGPSPLAEEVDRDPASHWGFTSVGGVLGGWGPDDLESLGGDKYRACGPSDFEGFAPQGYANNNIPYAPLEMYLMGFLPPEEVPDILVAVNPVIASQEDPCVTFYADAMETVTIEDIIAANGPRVPAVEEAQKHFRVAVIVIAEKPLSEEEWLDYEAAMGCLESTAPCGILVNGVTKDGQDQTFAPLSFYEAAGGRASLQFVLLEEIRVPSQSNEYGAASSSLGG